MTSPSLKPGRKLVVSVATCSCASDTASQLCQTTAQPVKLNIAVELNGGTRGSGHKISPKACPVHTVMVLWHPVLCLTKGNRYICRVVQVLTSAAVYQSHAHVLLCPVADCLIQCKQCCLERMEITLNCSMSCIPALQDRNWVNSCHVCKHVKTCVRICVVVPNSTQSESDDVVHYTLTLIRFLKEVRVKLLHHKLPARTGCLLEPNAMQDFCIRSLAPPQASQDKCQVAHLHAACLKD